MLLEPKDIEELGWEMTRVERRRFEMALDELRQARGQSRAAVET